MQSYSSKERLLSSISKLDEPPEFLFYYLNEKSSYRFSYFATFKLFYENLSKLTYNGHHYVYEMVLANVKRKPYIDMEKIYATKKIADKVSKKLLPQLQSDIKKVFKEQYNQKISKSDILILNGSGQVDKGYKMSYHMIVSPPDRTLYYTNSKYTDSSSYHLYTSLLALNSDYSEVLDTTVYNSYVSLRIIESSKYSYDLRPLIPIDPTTFDPLELNTNDKMNYLLTHIKSPNICLKTPIIEQTKSLKKIFLNKPPTTDVSEYLLKLVKKIHPSVVHMGFYENVFHNFNYENRNEKCPISGAVHAGSNGFYVFETPRGYYMKCHSSKCEGSKHIGYSEMSNDFIDDGEQIDQRYLIMDGIIEKDSDDVVKEHIVDWLSNTNKLLVVKSAMGTGKTSMIEKILDYDKSLKNILWITHRQTLTKQIYGQFKKKKFINYMDYSGCLFEYDRLIVQIDSLFRIKKYESNGDFIIKKYDLVIIDEIEGNLNHFSSPFLEKVESTSRDIFDFMLCNMRNSLKILLLDADIGFRTQMLSLQFKFPILINNNYLPVKKKFIITNNTGQFEKDILNDISDGKKICVVSMTADFIDKMSTLLDDKDVKYLAHTSRSDDKLKKKLENVNNSWCKYQVVLYSPCIESGVDFNVDHFDKIYGVLKNGKSTCSQRAFLQMVGRIRKICNQKIYCLYNGPIELHSQIYTYDDVLSYFRYYESMNGKKIIRSGEYEEIVENGTIRVKKKSSEISLYDIISIYNEVEQLNKNSMSFLTVLNMLIQSAGHELVLDITDTPKKPTKVDTLSLKERVIEIDEREYNLKKLLTKQSANSLSDDEKIAIRKFFLIKTFGIRDTSDREVLKDFLGKFYDKELKFKRFADFFGYCKSDDGDDYDNLSSSKMKLRRKIVVDILNIFLNKEKKRYKSGSLVNKSIDEVRYKKALKDISKKSLYFKSESKNRSLFFKSKGESSPLSKKNKQYYIKTIQNTLGLFGIDLKRGNRVRVGKKRKFVYSLSVDEQIKKIADFKYGKKNNINIYSELFD
jgi:hypothetical protein